MYYGMTPVNKLVLEYSMEDINKPMHMESY